MQLGTLYMQVICSSTGLGSHLTPTCMKHSVHKSKGQKWAQHFLTCYHHHVSVGTLPHCWAHCLAPQSPPWSLIRRVYYMHPEVVWCIPATQGLWSVQSCRIVHASMLRVFGMHRVFLLSLNDLRTWGKAPSVPGWVGLMVNQHCQLRLEALPWELEENESGGVGGLRLLGCQGLLFWCLQAPWCLGILSILGGSHWCSSSLSLRWHFGCCPHSHLFSPPSPWGVAGVLHSPLSGAKMGFLSTALNAISGGSTGGAWDWAGPCLCVSSHAKFLTLAITVLALTLFLIVSTHPHLHGRFLRSWNWCCHQWQWPRWWVGHRLGGGGPALRVANTRPFM